MTSLGKRLAIPVWAFFFALAWAPGCSGAKTKPLEGAHQEEASQTRRTRHPASLKVADLRSLFSTPDAPPLETLAKCDFDYQVERKLSGTKSRLFMVLPQYVFGDPAKYHWCFYFKILQLSERLVGGEQALAHVEFLADIARIFQVEFNDARYLVNAIQAYKDVSQLEFFTRLSLSNETRQELSISGEELD